MANLKTSTQTLYRWIKKKPLIRLIENSYIKYGKTWLFKAFISFIKKIYQNRESIISNNGFLSDPFSLSRGVRQGCPLSLFLYIMNGEVINLNSKSNKKIVRYPIPKQKEQLKLSQYADDTNFFVVTEESIMQILNLATGATINISKTNIAPLANAKIDNLDQKIENTQITNPNDFIKILGMYFTNDLQKTSTFNWELCTSILEKQLQQLSRRHLSLRGKAILLNTLILSKVTFLSNIFPILNQALKQIETKIFKHTWQFTTKEPIARKTLFLPKTQGGIGLTEPKNHSLAMRIKHFLLLKEEHNQENRITFARYFLAITLCKLPGSTRNGSPRN